MATATSGPKFCETKEYEVDRGKIDLGRKYEYEMVTLISLRCLLQDFDEVQIAMNATGLGAWDDVIVKAKTKEGKDIKILIQLKHHENKGKKLLSRETFLTPEAKGDYSLLKYCKHIDDLKKRLDSYSVESEQKQIIKDLKTFENVYFVLFTNKDTYKHNFLENWGWDKISFLNTAAKNDNLYKFNLGSVRELLSLPDLNYNMFLFAKQSKVNHLNEIIENEMKKVFQQFGINLYNCTILTKAYLDYVIEWSMGNLGNHYYLTKQDILYKLTELLLSQYELDLRQEQLLEFYDDPQKQLWNEIICDKVITVVDEDEEVIEFLKLYVGREMAPYCPKKIGETWSYKFSDEEQNQFYIKYTDLKRGMLKIVGQYKKVTLYSIFKCLWYNERLPLLLQIKTLDEFDDILKIINISNCKLKVIILKANNLKLTMKKNISDYFATLSDLNNKNREKILDCLVKLQGRSFNVMLKELIDYSLFAYISCNAIINILMLNYNIGIDYEPLSKYFIERNLLKAVVTTNVLGIQNETFVVEIKENSDDRLIRHKLDELISTFGTKSNIYISDELNATQIEELKLERKPIHRLVFQNDLLEWRESFGSTTNIQSYRMINEININGQLFNVRWSDCTDENWLHHKVEDILTFNKRNNWFNCVNVVSASPGMGKSTLLNYIALRTSTEMWVLYVNLIDHDEYYDEIRRTSSKKESLTAQVHLKYFNDTILTNGRCSNMQLAQAVFQHFVDRKQVLVLLDGLDEVPIPCKNEVVKIANCLHEAGFSVWVTTRPHLARELEDKFSTMAFTLKPFSPFDQQHLLNKYFRCITGPINDNKSNHQTLIKEFVEKLVKASKHNLNDYNDQFLGVALQTKLLANAFTRELKHSLTKGIVQFEDRFDLLHLYKEFMKGKDTIVRNKLGKGARNTKSLVEEHQQLFALKLLFDNRNLFRFDIEGQIKAYYYDENKIQCLQQDGVTVIQRSLNNKKFQVSFLHRTFAEYLAACWLFHNLNSECQTSRWAARDLLHRRHEIMDEYEFLFRIFDSMLAADSQLHKLIIRGRLDEAQELIKSNPEEMNVLDQGGRSILHTVAVWGHRQHNIYDQKDKDKRQNEIRNFVEQIPVNNIKDTKDILGYTPLDYALLNDGFTVANKLCEKTNKLTVTTSMLQVFRKNIVLLLLDNFEPVFKIIFPSFVCQNFLKDGKPLVDDETIQIYCHGKRFIPNKMFNEILDRRIKQLGVTTVSELLIQMNIRSTVAEPYYYDLRFAAAFGTARNVEDLLSKHVTSNREIFNNYYTPLYWAIQHNRVEIVKLLLSYGEVVNQRCLGTVTPLHCAAQNGFNDIVQELLSLEADVDVQDDNGETPLLLALHFKHVETAKLLLSHGANINIKDTHNHSVLHYAAEHGCDDFIPELLKYIDINCQDSYNWTPLCNAIVNGNISTIECLLHNGADCNIPNMCGNLPLHTVVQVGIYEVLPKIFNKTNNVNVVTYKGETPLHLAIGDHIRHYIRVLHGTAFCTKTVEFLLKNGSSTNIQDFEGNTALHYLCKYPKIDKDITEIVKLVLTENGDVNLKNNEGQIPLHFLLRNMPPKNDFQHFFNILLLLITDHNVNIQDIKGNTPLHFILKNVYIGQKRKHKVVQSLLDKGADVNIKNKFGETALVLAFNRNYKKIISLIQQKSSLS